LAHSPQRAIGLWAIIVFKLLKGTLLLALALGVFSLLGDDLAHEFTRLVRWIRMDPERQFFSDLADRLALITPETVRWIATGTLLYSFFSLAEAVGLALRLSWVGWVAIGESAFFVPIEIYELAHDFRWVIFGVLVVNVFIVYYLVRNRERIFRHH
jgi:uncharacterized membrane protein (DUF2068 family)